MAASFMLQGKAREMGLGPLNTGDVTQARAEAAECRRLVLAGTDPIEARDTGRTQALIEASRSKTFKECAKAYIAALNKLAQKRQSVNAQTAAGELSGSSFATQPMAAPQDEA